MVQGDPAPILFFKFGAWTISELPLSAGLSIVALAKMEAAAKADTRYASRDTRYKIRFTLHEIRASRIACPPACPAVVPVLRSPSREGLTKAEALHSLKPWRRRKRRRTPQLKTQH